jgi:hypothetical protein
VFPLNQKHGQPHGRTLHCTPLNNANGRRAGPAAWHYFPEKVTEEWDMLSQAFSVVNPPPHPAPTGAQGGWRSPGGR